LHRQSLLIVVPQSLDVIIIVSSAFSFRIVSEATSHQLVRVLAMHETTGSHFKRRKCLRFLHSFEIGKVTSIGS
jgi:hypothetical protein